MMKTHERERMQSLLGLTGDDGDEKNPKAILPPEVENAFEQYAQLWKDAGGMGDVPTDHYPLVVLIARAAPSAFAGPFLGSKSPHPAESESESAKGKDQGEGKGKDDEGKSDALSA